MTPHNHRGGNAILPIRFFKIILQTNIERLKIPNKFIRIYGGGLSNPVFMKPPDGSEWKVYWTKQNGEVWLQKGWKEFIENYSLDEGFLVVFKYQGTSNIDVLILHHNALEIHYPCHSFQENDNLHQSDDESVKILNEWPHNKKMKGESDEKGCERTTSLNWPSQSGAQEVARKFVSCNPFFTVLIEPVHVAECRMSLPSDMKGCIEKNDKYVRLQIGERSWNVKLILGPSRSSMFSAGWSLFAAESELLPGDVCVFELISKQDLVFQVHHLHFKVHTASMAGLAGGGNATLPISFFKMILKINKEKLKIPNKFMRRYGGGLPNPVYIKPPDGIEWKVYWTKQNGEVWFVNGWKEFVENYCLDEGYLVVFKYEGTSQIDVLILDHTSIEIEYLTCDENDNLDDKNQTNDESIQILDEWPDQKPTQITGEKAITERGSSLNWPRQERAQEIARKFISNNPFFTFYMKSSFLAHSRVTLPGLKVDVENKEKYVKLKIGERSWDVKLLPSYTNTSSRVLSAGWTLFARQNQLLQGDVCVFELISTQDLLFQVHVFRN
ncbi:hypothetical protein VNO77_12013 [Canavalia gladiata]|uniref:TF-B3 domain-containing protein n=1 Tax=Canavalia gladiata TaxID=3824 RepID=A0AAN9M079_CANGL